MIIIARLEATFGDANVRLDIVSASLLTVAWHTTPSVRHFPSNGQDIFRRQLLVSQTVGLVLVCSVSMALLCDEMILAIFGMQL